MLIQEIYLFVKGLTLLTNTWMIDIFEMFEPMETDSLLYCVESDGFCSLGC